MNRVDNGEGGRKADSKYLTCHTGKMLYKENSPKQEHSQLGKFEAKE